MVPVVAIVRGTRKAVNRLDDATTDHDDPAEQAAYEERQGQKRVGPKAPAVVDNIFKRIFGGGKKGKQPAGQQAQEEQAPAAVPLGAAK
ncbi:hypothetical protein ABPG75_009929 [Micractinium tetrahymenae]